MFTILHKRADSENIFKACQVQFIPWSEEMAGVEGIHLLAGPGDADGDPSVRLGRLRDGTVFVMNDRGATVARYDLDIPRSSPPSQTSTKKE
jgi:hypothetical protein